MARLTWQNVQNPNFSGVADSYRVMSQLLGNATQSGLDMINTVKNTNSEAADRAILQRLAGVQDPAQFDPNAIIGADARNASLKTLGTVADRPGTLINWATNRENLEQSQYGNQRLREGHSQLDANQAAINDAILRGTKGDMSGVQQLGGLRSDLLGAITEDVGGLASGQLSRARSGQLIDQSAYNHGRDVRGDEITDQTQAAMVQLARTAADPQHAEQLMWKYAQENNVAPEVVNNLIARGIGATPSGSTGVAAAMNVPVSAGPIGSSGATFAEPQRAVAGALQTAGLSAPVIAGIMGNLHVEGGYTGDKGDGGTAAGIAQWRGPRREAFKARYGVDPSDAPHAQQAEFLVWELTTPEGRRTAGISEDRANQILNASTPAEAAELFDQHYERSNGQHRDRRVAAANDFDAMFTQASQNFGPVQNANTQADIVRANTMANSGSLNQRLASMEGQPDQPISDLTKGLQEAGYQGYTQGELADEIRAIAAEAKVTNAQAALVMQENLTQRSMFMKGIGNIPWLGEGVAENTFDRDQMVQAAREYKEAGLTTQSQNNERAVVSAAFAKAAERVTQLDAQILQAQQRYAQTNAPELLERVQQLQAQRAAALLSVEAVRGVQQGVQSFTSADLAAEARRAAEQAERAAASTPEARAANIEQQRRRDDILLRGAFR